MKNRTIYIATTMRYHLVDLARELECQGYNVKLFTIVPKKRIMQFGLKSENVISMFYWLFPIIALDRLCHSKYPIHKYFFKAVDYFVSLFVSKCDLFIGLGTAYYRCFHIAKRNNIPTILEWGSKHIETQQAILRSINAKTNHPYYNKRSSEIYTVADYIAIPSKHVEESFVERGVSKHKILINPYGVQLKDFPPTCLDSNETYDLITVGRWCLRKGCDILSEFCKQTNYTMLHVGGKEPDLEYPDVNNFTHIDAVDEKKLTIYYAKAKAFILLSREEGLSLVQCQALVSGLPIICTKDTGGEDLKDFIDDPNYIIVIDDLSISSIKKAVDKALLLASNSIGVRNISSTLEKRMSWNAYGKRYAVNIEKIFNKYAAERCFN